MNKLPAIVIALLAWPALAPAQVERSGGAGNAQVMQQLQQLASERTQLQADNARLKQDLTATRKELDALKASQTGAQRRLQSFETAATRAGAERDSSQRELEQSRTRMQELVTKFRETATALRDVEAERATLTGTLVRRDTDLARCVEHNGKLYELNGEILTKLGDRGFWSTLGGAEPFTRLKRVQLDNLMEEYRARAEDQQVRAMGAR